MIRGIIFTSYIFGGADISGTLTIEATGTLLTAAGFGEVDALGTTMVATAVDGSLVPGRTTRGRWLKISSRIKLAWFPKYSRSVLVRGVCRAKNKRKESMGTLERN
nr:hypothetical protein [Tanacetum cinerariifolium]